MRFRSFLFLSASGFAAIVIAVFAFEAGRYWWSLEMDDMNRIASTMAQTGAASIDGDVLRTAIASGREDTPEYKSIQQQLQRIRVANSANGAASARFVYTEYALPQNPSDVLFAVDADSASERTHNRIGEHAPATHDGVPLLEHLERIEVDPYPIVDGDGTWLTAHAPVFDRNGVLAGALSLDIPHDGIDAQFWRIVKIVTGLASLAIVGECLLLFAMARWCDQRARLGIALAGYQRTKEFDRILRRGKPPYPERRRIVVMFADIRGFTAKADDMPADAVFSMLNNYFSKMVPLVRTYNGFIDKFIGDGLMAVWGTLVGDPNQDKDAIRAAIDMQRAVVEVRRLNPDWNDLRIGIGINTGWATVGNVGSNEHKEFTAIGDMVNVASRVESLTKKLKHDILVTEEVYNATRSDGFKFLKLEPVEISGSNRIVTLYAVQWDDSQNTPGPKNAVEVRVDLSSYQGPRKAGPSEIPAS